MFKNNVLNRNNAFVGNGFEFECSETMYPMQIFKNNLLNGKCSKTMYSTTNVQKRCTQQQMFKNSLLNKNNVFVRNGFECSETVYVMQLFRVFALIFNECTVFKHLHTFINGTSQIKDLH